MTGRLFAAAIAAASVPVNATVVFDLSPTNDASQRSAAKPKISPLKPQV